MNIKSKLLPLSFMLGVVFACVDDDEPVATDTGDCVDGTQGCSCMAGNTCYDSLECYSGVCVSAPDAETGQAWRREFGGSLVAMKVARPARTLTGRAGGH